MMKKILLVGPTGMLGTDLGTVLNDDSNVDLIELDRKKCDITQRQEVEVTLQNIEFDYLINAAAYTNVEQAEIEKDACMQVNYEGTKNLLEACAKKEATFIQISTDYVFDGKNPNPYSESDITNPLSQYGKSKELSEKLVSGYKKNYILRTSWLYGKSGSNFVQKVLQKISNNEDLTIVSDQIGSPTYSYDLATMINALIQNDPMKYGIYHMTNLGYYSWYSFAEMIVKILKVNSHIQAVDSKYFNTLAKRPLNSRLSKDKFISLNIIDVPTVENALERYLKDMEIIQ